MTSTYRNSREQKTAEHNRSSANWDFFSTEFIFNEHKFQELRWTLDIFR